MGCVQQAVLEFDQEVQAPWRPRLVVVPEAGEVESMRPLRPHPSRRTRVGACAPPTARSVPRPVQVSRRTSPTGAVLQGPRASPCPVPTPARPTRLRLTRRARRLAVVLALTAGLALGSLVGSLLGGGNDLRLAGGSSVVVQSGDTLWSIASSLDGEGDVRRLVDEIQRLNGLEAGVLVPGQILELP